MTPPAAPRRLDLGTPAREGELWFVLENSVFLKAPRPGQAYRSDREIERERKSEKGRRGGTRRQRQEIGVHQTTGRRVTVTVPHPAREPPTPSIGSRAKVELILM